MRKSYQYSPSYFSRKEKPWDYSRIILYFVPWGEPTKRYQLVDYYDLIEYLAERSWLEKILSRTSATSTMELFVTLANSFYKELHLRSCRSSCSLVWKPDKSYDRGWVMTSTPHFIFVYNLYIGCLTVNKVGSLNPIKCLVGFEPKPFDSITKP